LIGRKLLMPRLKKL
jgi:putative transposase